ncbi:MAG: HAD family hydrolase [Promethearchaeota archaeon]
MSLNNIKAILFDLDGTLININLKGFIPDYMKLLSYKVKHIIRPSKFISLLMKASNQIDQNDGKATNEQIFEKVFFPLNGYSRKEVNPFFDDFYENDFIKLRVHTEIKQEARSVVSGVFEKGYDVVIATTPVIPLTAIQQRLDWANIGDFNYKLITSIENMRANKPHRYYYQQIFDFLNCPPEACLMVGDEDKDMKASLYGCKTYLVPSSNTNLDTNSPQPTYQGPLENLLNLL